jgi:hypothetical protein
MSLVSAWSGSCLSVAESVLAASSMLSAASRICWVARLGAVHDGVELAAGAPALGVEGAEMQARELLHGAADGAMDVVGLALELVEVADRYLIPLVVLGRAFALAAGRWRRRRRPLLDQVAQRPQLVENLMMLEHRNGAARSRVSGRGASRLAARSRFFDAEGFLPHWHGRPLRVLRVCSRCRLNTRFMGAPGSWTGALGRCDGLSINHDCSTFTRKKP